MIIYHIRLPQAQDVDAFVAFMREEYFPAIRKSATRVGQVTELQLLARENEHEGDDHGREFFWHVGWSGLSSGKAHVDDEDVDRKFEAFGAVVERLGSYEQVASWHPVKPA